MNNINYREDQIPIINYQSGTMAVPAVPGAGKTFIVTNLVAKLLKDKNHNDSKILILTYMNSAVSNFKGRIKKILEDNEIKEENSYEVMTIHSLAVKIIKEKPEIVMLNEDFSIADDLQKTIILTECINRFKASGGENIYFNFLKEQKDQKWRDIAIEQWENGFYDLIGNSISELKYKEISPDDLENIIIKNSHKGILNIILPIYRYYDKSLKQQGLLDYDDILILALRALNSDENLKHKFQNRYKYIFEDECQDSNEIQGKIIKVISELNNNLVRVGDINQSITGTFSSSDPKFFKDFIDKADYCYRMDMSNRSSKDVLDLANRLVKYVTSEFRQNECKNALEDMEIKTVPVGLGYKENPNPESYNINLKWYETWEQELDNTVRYTKGINKKYPDKSIGILVPYNDQITQVAKILMDNDMEFEELGPNSLNKRKTLINMGYILDFLLNLDDSDKLINVLDKIYINSENEIGKKDFLHNLKNYNSEQIIYDDISQDIIIDKDSDIYNGFVEGIYNLREILEYPIVRLDLLIMYIGERMNISNEDKAIIDYLAFYIKYMSEENPNININDVYNILMDTRNKVFNHIIDVVYEINGYEPKPGSITICNYHKSKGLEWDCVFLLGLVEYNFPDNVNQKFQCDKWYLKDAYKNPIAVIKSEIDELMTGKKTSNYSYNTKIDLINEKIRLLYVGITRAKEMLVLSGSAYKDSQDVGKKNKEQKPSIYLRELNNYIANKRRK